MSRFVAIAVIAACLDVVPATGQSIGDVDVTASFRTRLEDWRWFESTAEDRYTFSGSLLRLGLVRQRPAIGWRIEAAVPILLGLPPTAVAPPPQGQSGTGPAYYVANGGEETVVSPFLKQAYLRIGSPPGGTAHGIRAGRFEFADGAELAPADPTLAAVKRDRVAHRLIGTFGWSHVGRSFDGVQYGYTGNRANLTGLAVRPTQGVFDADGWSPLDVGLAYAALTLPWSDADNPGEARIFGALYADYRDHADLVKVDNRPLTARQADRANITVATVGGHYLRALAMDGGTIDILLWAAGQVGGWGSQDHRAWAAAAELGVQPTLLPMLRPWVRIGWTHGSGDGDATDERHGTFFQMLPTPRIYARLPFYNMMNTQEVSGSLILRPGQRFTLRGDLRSLWLADRSDLWYAGGGAFEPGSFGYAGRPSGDEQRIGLLADISLDVRLHPNLTGSVYLGRAGGGGVIDRIYPEDGTARLGYIELEYRR